MKVLLPILAVGLALVPAGCQNESKTVEVSVTQTPQAVQPVETEAEVDDFEDYEEETDEDFEEETEYEEEPEEEESEEEQPENLISLEDMSKSFDDLIDVYNSVYELYYSDEVPRDEGVESILDQADKDIADITSQLEGDLETDEERNEILIRMGDIQEELSSLMDPLLEAAEGQAAEYEYLLEYVNANYEYLQSYFEALWNYLSENGGTDNQVDSIVSVRDRIEEIDDMPRETADDLRAIDDWIDSLTKTLDNLNASL